MREGRFLKFEKPRFITGPPLRIEQVIDSVSSFGGRLHATGYRNQGGSYRGLIRILEQQSYDSILPFAVSPGRFPLPWVRYIPDLQHTHRPEFFSGNECAGLELPFTKVLRVATPIVGN